MAEVKETTQPINKMTTFARGCAELTIELLRNLTASKCEENVIVSPVSIQTCMALVFAGAKGETANEIAKVLKFSTVIAEEVTALFAYLLKVLEQNDFLKIVNKLYVMQGFEVNSEYAAIVQQQHKAAVESLDFAEPAKAAQLINQWIKDKTSGKITNMIQSNQLDETTRLVLLNTLYLKAEWQSKFKTICTKPGDFWLNEDEYTEVQFLSQNNAFAFAEFEDLQCIGLEMPYKDCDLSMFVLLPQAREGLTALIQMLGEVNLLDLIEKMDRKQVEIKMPKFEIDFSIEMTKLLQQMGINKAFSERDADLGHMLATHEPLYVNNVFHKVSIEISEEGTIAAAATAARAILKCRRPIYFIADHPFIYWIGNRTSILFAGTFVRPQGLS